MKKLIYNSRKKKFLKKHPRKARFVNFEKTTSVLLLFESDGKGDESMKNIVQSLKNDQKHVLALGFSKLNSPTEYNLSEVIVFNQKDVDFFQKPKKAVLDLIKQQKFDLLIDLSVSKLIPIMYLSLYCDASMKISTKVAETQIFDFILSAENSKEKNTDNIQYFFKEIIFYLKSIQTTD